MISYILNFLASIMENCSCDDRISKLLKYKLSGREIELCELSEKDFEEINEG